MAVRRCHPRKNGCPFQLALTLQSCTGGFAYRYLLQAWTVHSDGLRCATLCVLHWSNSFQRYGNVDPLSIDYAFRPCLRIRLTPGGRTCPGKPWNFGDRDSHPVFRYSCPHNRFLKVHRRLHFGFTPAGTLPYHDAR